jgi:hypothetical protein
MMLNYWDSFRYNVNDAFFGVHHAHPITAKQLKLRDISKGLAPMPKLAYEIKVCSMYKINSFSFIPDMDFASLFQSISPEESLMKKLARKQPSTLQGLMDKVKEFINQGENPKANPGRQPF